MDLPTALENSGTYKMLLNMGFASNLSKCATKIHLNDIEEAVEYCFRLSSPHSRSNSADIEYIIDHDKQGINWTKCHNLLETAHPKYLPLFITWFRDEEFEDEQLIEEFVDNPDWAESFFIQYIQDNISDFGNDFAERLFNDLSVTVREGLYINEGVSSPKLVSHAQYNSFASIGYAEIFEPLLISGYVREIGYSLMCKYGEIPNKVFALCHSFYPKFTESDNVINININMKSSQNPDIISNIQSLYASQCNTLISDALDCPTELYSLFTIGKENNLPLLTYVIDAYNRFQISKYRRFMIVLERVARTSGTFKSQKYQSKRKVKDISIESFVMNECVAFQDSPLFQRMCIKSMQYLMAMNCNRFSKPSVSMECRSCYRIDDSLMDFTKCIFSTYSFINEYINNTLSFSSMPCQFDLIIIPKNVYDVYDSSDDDSGRYPKVSFNDSIEELLLGANVPFVQAKIGKYPSTNLLNNLVNILSENNKGKNQRYCILIDRRGETNDIFVYQTMTDNINANPEQFVNESLFDNSIKCLVPGLCGCNDALNGYLFSLSFHVISRYEIRTYLNINSSITRFFIQDLRTYLPQYFMQNDINYDSVNFKRKYRKCKQMLSDSKFDEFYKLILMNDKQSPKY